jgi:hypothetical protein
MTKPNTYRAYVTLVGNFDPNDISTELGVQPTRSWKKGNINPITRLERTRSRWCLDSSEAETVCLEDQIVDLLWKLRPCAAKFVELRSKIDGVMQLVAYFHQGYPGFALDETVLQDLADLKLGIDCDFYYLYSDKREDSD